MPTTIFIQSPFVTTGLLLLSFITSNPSVFSHQWSSWRTKTYQHLQLINVCFYLCKSLFKKYIIEHIWYFSCQICTYSKLYYNVKAELLGELDIIILQMRLLAICTVNWLLLTWIIHLWYSSILTIYKDVFWHIQMSVIKGVVQL